MWMPRLPVNRFGRAGWPVDECLFAVTGEDKNAVRLVCVNAHARRLGLYAGMTLASARAAAPELITQMQEPRRDEAFLKALQRWTEKFTPWSTCDEADGLVLNVTGCAHLFGGEEAMAARLLEELGDLKVEARIGVADTQGAARAAAHFGRARVTVIGPGGTRDALQAFPIEALFTDEKTCFELKRLGLKRIGDLYPLKSADLARRFGFGLLRRYEKLLGAAADPVTPMAAQPTFAARISFPDPIGLLDDVTEALKRLTAQVCKRLCDVDFGVRALRLAIVRADKQEIEVEIGLARPTQAADQIMRQFALKLDKVDAGAGIDMMRLAAVKTEPFKPYQKRFGEAENPDRLDELIATLGNRLGFDRVLRWAPVASHLPRRSYRFVEAIRAGEGEGWLHEEGRPLMIFEGEPLTILKAGRPPQCFEWRRETYRLISAQGPERIGHEWWKGANGDVIRDYWRIESAEGARLWLATRPGEKPPKWEVAGVFP